MMSGILIDESARLASSFVGKKTNPFHSIYVVIMRVLIIDDSVVSRRLLGDALSKDPKIDTSTASSGKIGLARIAQQQPDLVTLDVEMPEMDGIETLKLIRQQYPRLPVIMVSRLTEQGAAATINALFFGANDYVAKPEAKSGLEQAIISVRRQLIPKIHALTSHIRSNVADRQQQPSPLFPHAIPHRQVVEIIAIGSSTGGPNALTELLTGLAHKISVPIVIAQHTLPVFSRHIASRLSDKTGLDIKEGCHGAGLKLSDIWLAPGNQHMLLNRQKGNIQLQLEQSLAEEATPSVDRLFESVANIYQGGVLSVVLTGMGKDGLEGCRAVKQNGGQILVQDESSSVVWGMPGAVANAGLADEIVALEQMPAAILKRLNCR